MSISGAGGDQSPLQQCGSIYIRCIRIGSGQRARILSQLLCEAVTGVLRPVLRRSNRTHSQNPCEAARCSGPNLVTIAPHPSTCRAPAAPPSRSASWHATCSARVIEPFREGKHTMDVRRRFETRSINDERTASSPHVCPGTAVESSGPVTKCGTLRRGSP